MKILLTGSRGFIGSHLRARLPHGIDLLECDDYEPRVHGHGARSPEVFWQTRSGDIPPEALEEIDVVIHLGAQVGVADSMLAPARYVYGNTADTFRLFENLKRSGARPRIVVASSMSVYGDPRTKDPITEDHPVRPSSIYGLTKFDQEALALLYGDILEAPVAALRFFNVYGEGQALSNPYTGVLAIFASALLRGEAPTVFEDGEQTRDFVYVGDVANAILLAALDSEMTGVFNVSTGVATSIKDIATSLATALETPILPDITHEKRPGDIRHCVGNSERLRSFGWEPRTFEEGLARYVRGLRSNVAAPSDLEAYLAQVDP